jgi:hypothetical protein
MGWLKNYLAFCLQNVQFLEDFCGQIMPSYFCTIPMTFSGKSIFTIKKHQSDEATVSNFGTTISDIPQTNDRPGST